VTMTVPCSRFCFALDFLFSYDEDKRTERGKRMKIVSACLMGCECRYDQKDNLVSEIEKLVKDGKAIPVCPEQLGGLSTPRPPAEIVGGDGFDVLDGKAKVIDNRGNDVTEQFLQGARQALHMAQVTRATEAILKERSPSCGSTMIYDGTFSKNKQKGVGVTAALLIRHGISVRSEETMN
jgi:uncharacterized protein YbbK (DUF523 family)